MSFCDSVQDKQYLPKVEWANSLWLDYWDHRLAFGARGLEGEAMQILAIISSHHNQAINENSLQSKLINLDGHIELDSCGLTI